jgi:hypothetical protein
MKAILVRGKKNLRLVACAVSKQRLLLGTLRIPVLIHVKQKITQLILPTSHNVEAIVI